MREGGTNTTLSSHSEDLDVTTHNHVAWTRGLEPAQLKKLHRNHRDKTLGDISVLKLVEHASILPRHAATIMGSI